MAARRNFPHRKSLAPAIPAIAIALLAGAAVLVWLSLRARGIDVTGLTPEEVEGFVGTWGPWSAVGSIVLMVLHSFVPLPSEIIALANGILFGALWGVVVTWVGAMLGAVLAFGFARWLGRPFIRWAVSGTRWRRIEALTAKPSSLLLVRLVPVISFNLINYAAGLMGVSWWTFLWTTALGILPLTIAMVLLGRQLMTAPWWAWLLVVIGVVAAGLSARWLRGRLRGEHRAGRPPLHARNSSR